MPNRGLVRGPNNRRSIERMANADPLVRETLAKIKPWANISGTNTWNEKDEKAFVANDRRIVRNVQSDLRDGSSIDDIAETLVDTEKFKNYDEAYDSVVGIDGGAKVTRQVQMGVPNASADEAVTRILMNANRSNNDRIRPNNQGGGAYFGTDNIGDSGLLIDSQTRDNTLMLGILNKLTPRVIDDAKKNLQLINEPKLIDMINQLRYAASRQNNYNLAQEDKFLHSKRLQGIDNSDWYLSRDRRSGEYVNDIVEKNAIVTNDRPYMRQAQGSPFKNRHGHYNPTIPRGIGYVDLEPLRDRLLGTDLNQLGRAISYSEPDNYGKRKLRLGLSGTYIDKLTRESEQIDPRILDFFKGG